jgi:hypothetical protein
MNRIYVILVRKEWWALISMIMNLYVSRKAGNFLTSEVLATQGQWSPSLTAYGCMK